MPTGVQPRAIASHGAVSVVATIKNIFAVKDGKKVGTEIPIVGIPTVVAISPDGSEVAVGTEVSCYFSQYESNVEIQDKKS